MRKIDVCWQSKDFVDLDYEYVSAYGREDMCRYQSPIYKTSVGNCIYHLPNPMPHFVNEVIEKFNYKPKMSITEGVYNFVKWYRNYYNL